MESRYLWALVVVVLNVSTSSDGQRSRLDAFRWRSGYSSPWRRGLCVNSEDVGCRSSFMESPRVLMDLKDMPNVCAMQQVAATNKKYYSQVLAYRPKQMCNKPAYVRYHCCVGYESILGVKGCMGVLPIENIADTAKREHLRMFLEATETAGLSDNLRKQGAYTVFVPDNSAFRQASSRVSDMVASNDNTLLKFHFTNGRRNTDQLNNGVHLNTLGNDVDRMRVAKYSNGIITVNCARITVPNVQATNGVLHVVDKVVEPAYSGTIMDYLKSDSRFTDLVDALETTGVAEELRSSKLKTMFAPTAEAFQSIPNDVLQRAFRDPDTLRDILRYHILPHDICSGAIFSSCGITTLEGSKLNTSCDSLDRLVINDAVVTQKDIVTSNGVIHVLDKVQIPEREELSGKVIFTVKDLTDVVNRIPNTAKFSQFLSNIGMEDILSSFDRPVTIFAPTDEAFEALAGGNLDAIQHQPEALRRILEYHLVDGKVTTSDMVSDMLLQTFLKEGGTASPVRITLGPGQTFAANGAQLLSTDHVAGNGVLHVVDTVLLPPEQTLFDRVQLNSTLKTFLSVLEVSGISDLLQLPGNFTVFAPTDDAFDALQTSFLENLFFDPDKLKAVLQHHILPTTVFGTSMQPKLHYRYTTSQGETLKLQRLQDNTLTIGNGSVITEDILANNGNLFVIDTVLQV